MMGPWRGGETPILEGGRSLWPGTGSQHSQHFAEKTADIKTVFFIYGLLSANLTTNSAQGLKAHALGWGLILLREGILGISNKKLA